MFYQTFQRDLPTVPFVRDQRRLVGLASALWLPGLLDGLGLLDKGLRMFGALFCRTS
jgi:hypothetical protein